MSSPIATVRAPNPSLMTLDGTNSYLVDCGGGEALCIDPGPAISSHVEHILGRCKEMRCTLTQIYLTHGHPDHAPAAAELSARTGAPVAAHQNSHTPHDRGLRGGERLRLRDFEFEVIEAPGHCADHLVFYAPQERALFTGDVVVGSGYVLVTPPDGDMRAYMHTLERLMRDFAGARVIYGGHGEPIFDPAAKLADYLEHRRAREEQLLQSLASDTKPLSELVRSIYVTTDSRLWPAAAEQLRAHLIALEREGRVRSHEEDGELRWSRSSNTL